MMTFVLNKISKKQGDSLKTSTISEKELKTTYIDLHLYRGITGFHGVYPYSQVAIDHDRQYPY